MRSLRLLFKFTARGIFLGGALALITGSICSVPTLFYMIVTVPFALIMGVVLGGINGLAWGMMTLCLRYVFHNQRQYRIILLLSALTITFPLFTFAVNEFLHLMEVREAIHLPAVLLLGSTATAAAGFASQVIALDHLE